MLTPESQKTMVIYAEDRHWDAGFPIQEQQPGPAVTSRLTGDGDWQVEEGSIWTFEQEQSLVGSQVNTTIRMTAVKLSSGGLLLYSPVAPTQ